MDYVTLIDSSLQNIAQSFSENELAYLALTSKIELPIRDRLAFLLHTKFQASLNVVISREWKRFDLVFLENCMPSLILEAKAMYSFDMFTSKAKKQYPTALQNDFDKFKTFFLNNSQYKTPEFYTLLLATHPHSLPNRILDGVVKYNHELHKYTPRSKSDLVNQVEKHFHEHKRLVSGEIYGGKAFGVRVSVFYWLFGPYKNI